MWSARDGGRTYDAANSSFIADKYGRCTHWGCDLGRWNPGLYRCGARKHAKPFAAKPLLRLLPGSKCASICEWRVPRKARLATSRARQAVRTEASGSRRTRPPGKGNSLLPRRLRRSVLTGSRHKRNDCSAVEFLTFETLNRKAEDSQNNNQNSSNARIGVAYQCFPTYVAPL
jgi:hypothetical protein